MRTYPDDDAPDGYWISAEGYARLAAELERDGHHDVAEHFYARSRAAAAAAELVDVDQVPEELEATESLPVVKDWVEQDDLHADYLDAMHERAEAEDGR